MSSRLRSAAATAFCVSLLAACGGGGTEPQAGGAGGGEVPSSCKPAHSVTTLEPGKLIVSVYVTPPYTVKEGSSYGGVDGDLIKKLAAMECLNVDMREIAAAGLIQSVQSKRADTALGGIYRTPERAQLLELTSTVYDDGMVLLGKADYKTVSDLKGKTVGSIQGYLWTADLQKVLGQDAVKIYMASDGMINDIKNGRLDAAVLTTAEAGYRVRQEPNAGFKFNQITADPRIASSEHPGEVVFPITKGNTALVKAFSDDIATLLKDGTVAAVLKKNGMPESAAAKP